MKKIVMLADRYICIQECDEGFDYTIYDLTFCTLDGGIMEEECSLDEALEMLVQELRANEGYAACVFGRVSEESKVKELSVASMDLIFDAKSLFDGVSTYSIFSGMDVPVNHSDYSLEGVILVKAGIVDSSVTPDVLIKEHNIKNQVLLLQLKGDVKTYYVDERGVFTDGFTLLDQFPTGQSVDRIDNSLEKKTCALVKKYDTGMRYKLLGRMQSDCQFFLGAGNRQLKCLWGITVEQHIAYMKALYISFPDEEKPEWISMEEIETYETAMAYPMKRHLVS